MGETMTPPIDPVRLHEARGAVRRAIAVALQSDFEKRYAELSPASGEEVVIDGPNSQKRALRIFRERTWSAASSTDGGSHGPNAVWFPPFSLRAAFGFREIFDEELFHAVG